MSRRKRSRYPALDPKLNLKGRRCYIEADYIRGTKNSDGELVIRALTDLEKEWLNKFYQETIVTTFKQDGTDFFDTVEERRSFWRDNNTRNVCLYNYLKKTGRLYFLDANHLDSLCSEESAALDPEALMIRMQESGAMYSDDLEETILRNEAELDRLQNKPKKLKS